MSEQDGLFMFAAACWTLLVATFAYFVGRSNGKQCGRDEQWIDDYIERSEIERNRRAPNGQYTSTKTVTKTYK